MTASAAVIILGLCVLGLFVWLSVRAWPEGCPGFMRRGIIRRRGEPAAQERRAPDA